jgi:hypothetical protein
MPLVARPRTAATELIGIQLAKLATPFADRLIRYDHATFQQEFFDIAEAEAEAKVQPHGVANNFDRKAMILIFEGSRRDVHSLTTSY